MSRRWVVDTFAVSGDEEGAFSRLVAETKLSPITLQVLWKRGLRTAAAIQTFLYPKLEALTPPTALRDMDTAVDRLVRARGDAEKVRIFGDYDVDGTTGTALLTWVFRDHGLTFDATQPDRFKDGYGLNVAAVVAAARDGVKVLVTVDCGITSFEAAEKAWALGMDLIVVDHHQVDPARGLPKAVAIVNPQRPDDSSGLKELCGCGLAFYLAMALRARGRELGWFSAGGLPNLKQHLDLVVIATAADMVPLTGDNRVLVRQGLEVLKSTKKPGLAALMAAAGLSQDKLSPGSLGFVLGPRINASGRMQNAGTAYRLLSTQDALEAIELAGELERLNAERMRVQDEIWQTVRERVEAGIRAGRFQNAIVVADPSWHEGVVGIVASRVTETFHRPAIVVSLADEHGTGFGKGSVRSARGLDVLAALRECREVLKGFGGHACAAGVTVSPEKVPELARAFDAAVGKLWTELESKDSATLEDRKAPLAIEGAHDLAEFDIKTLQELEALGPFGPGHPEPVFAVRALTREKRVLKGKHLKLQLQSDGSGAQATTWDAIWFHAVREKDELDAAGVDTVFELAGVPELNRFRGYVTPTFRIKDARKARES